MRSIMLKVIWCATFATVFAHEFEWRRKAKGFDYAVENTAGEEAWHIANAAVKAWKYHHHGFADHKIEPEWE